MYLIRYHTENHRRFPSESTEFQTVITCLLFYSDSLDRYPTLGLFKKINHFNLKMDQSGERIRQRILQDEIKRLGLLLRQEEADHLATKVHGNFMVS